MPRYIDADKADVEQISCFYGGECHIDDVKEWIDTQPTADVAEVVRCKDCNFCHYNAESGLYHCRRRGYFSEEVSGDDFCSYGIRKETK